MLLNKIAFFVFEVALKSRHVGRAGKKLSTLACVSGKIEIKRFGHQNIP